MEDGVLIDGILAESEGQLTDAQEKAAVGLAMGLSRPQAAAAAGVTEGAIRKWLNLPAFVTKRDNEAYNAFAELFPKAVQVTSELLDSADEKVRLAAAQSVLTKFAPAADTKGVKVVVEFGMEKPPMPEDGLVLEDSEGTVS